ncbi:hypothetical protein LEP1GSC124_3872, partial [Leptospira interrogans serovar Pyrogenes str. 200701872]
MGEFCGLICNDTLIGREEFSVSNKEIFLKRAL